MKDDALTRFLKFNNLLFKDYETTHKGLPYLGEGVENGDFSGYTGRIGDAFSLLGNNLDKLKNEMNEQLPSRYLIGGDPIEYEMFPLCKEYMIECLNQGNLYSYTSAQGDEDTKKEIIEYFKKEGFKRDKEINVNNIAFSMGTTQAFDIIIKAIGKPHDVVLMTGPTYGLFTFIPERNGVKTEIIPLSEADNWFVDPKKLSMCIDEINDKLLKEYAGKLPYQPRVVAFLNVNPNNPIGNVMSDKQIELIKQIGEVCLKKGVFVIDDIIYRDLTFDREHLALPMATIENFFDNVITITGLSKGYGLASMRAGIILANEYIIEAIDNYIFHSMDSLPIIQQRALAGAFNATERRYKEYEDYFSKIIPMYQYRLQVLIAMVNGIESIKDEKLKIQIKEDIEKTNPDNIDKIFGGIENVDFVNKTMAQSGFFSLLDFSKLRGKKYKDKVIRNENDVFEYLYEQEKIKVLIGKSLAWPENDNRLIVRVTTALNVSELILSMNAMNRCLRKLK